MLDAAKVDETWCDWVLISDEIIMVAESSIASAVALLLIYIKSIFSLNKIHSIFFTIHYYCNRQK